MSATRSQGIEFGQESALESAAYSLTDAAAYGRWRAHKLRCLVPESPSRAISIARLGQLSAAEHGELAAACRQRNFALYRTRPQAPPGREELCDFGARLGLRRFDHHLWAGPEGIAAIRRESGSGRSAYIPYTDRSMKWHTDGYYNAAGATVRGVIMHCVTPAAEGGANWLLDPELVYIALRDANPAYIEALMQPDVMTIPANRLEPGEQRPAVSGPVFSVDPVDGSLHMRYTARRRSIQWKEDAVTREAVAFLEALLTPPVTGAVRVRLQAGEGIVCNNVLHSREAFRDSPGEQRLLWRARYRDRIAGT